ncbi:hypothetical protein QJS10_CPA07g00452 [Acorus calamus]|uniref:Uncharacterized protein n=1 Tax=Acorus calamus TaxID=4465 RepID=A0AAV9EDQ9_ACOCL|nr:hypothetical protein QJS10_CPA07g00452 [Acorus calamus]
MKDKRMLVTFNESVTIKHTCPMLMIEAVMDGEKKMEVEPKEWRHEGVRMYLPIITILIILSNTSYQIYLFHNDVKTVHGGGFAFWIEGTIDAPSWTIHLFSPFAAFVVIWLILGFSVAGALYDHVVYGVEDVIFPWRSLTDLPLLVRAVTWVFLVLCFIGYSSALILYSVGKMGAPVV